MLSAGLPADTAPTKAAACTTWVTWCFLMAWRIRGMSSTSPCSNSILSRMSPMRLSSRWRANTTGRWPSLTNLRVVSAPMTPMPPVIRTFISSSIDLDVERLDQAAPVFQIALDQLAEILRAEVDALQRVGLEEVLGFGKVERLLHVRGDFLEQRGRQVRRPPQPEPHRGRKAR